MKKQSDGRYEMPLPLKSDNACLPNNRQLAVKRVPAGRLEVQDGKVNYVPHTGVYHPKNQGRYA